MGIPSSRKNATIHTLVSYLRCCHNKPGFDIHQPFHVDHIIAKEIRTLVGYILCIDPLTQFFKELVCLGKHAFERSNDSKADIVPRGAVADSRCTDFQWELYGFHLRFTFCRRHRRSALRLESRHAAFPLIAETPE